MSNPNPQSAPSSQASRRNDDGNPTLVLPDSWASLDSINLVDEWRTPVFTLEDVPTSIRKQFARIQAATFRELVIAYENSSTDNDDHIIRRWKLFLLLPRMLLHSLPEGGSAGTQALKRRVDTFLQGNWIDLNNMAKRSSEIHTSRPSS